MSGVTVYQAALLVTSVRTSRKLKPEPEYAELSTLIWLAIVLALMAPREPLLMVWK